MVVSRDLSQHLSREVSEEGSEVNGRGDLSRGLNRGLNRDLISGVQYMPVLPCAMDISAACRSMKWVFDMIVISQLAEWLSIYCLL